MSKNLITLMTTAAELRTCGALWQVVGKHVNRSPKTCGRWPSRYPQQWEQLYLQEQRKVYDEVGNEGLMVMRRLLRSDSEKSQLKAAEIVMRYGPHLALAKAAPAANVELPREDQIWLDAKHDLDRQRLQFNSVHGLPPEDEDAFYDDWRQRFKRYAPAPGVESTSGVASAPRERDNHGESDRHGALTRPHSQILAGIGIGLLLFIALGISGARSASKGINSSGARSASKGTNSSGARSASKGTEITLARAAGSLEPVEFSQARRASNGTETAFARAAGSSEAIDLKMPISCNAAAEQVLPLAISPGFGEMASPTQSLPPRRTASMRTLLTAHCFLFSMLASANAGTSNSLMDVSPDGKSLLVANRDNDSVTVVDIATRKALREILVGNHPEGVAWIANGPLALVTLNGDDRLAFVDADAGKVLDKLKVANEPYGVVAAKDGKRAYVTHDYPGVVSEIDVPGRKVLRAFKSGEWTRGIAIDAEEKTLYVTDFYSAKLHAIDIAEGKIVDSWNGHETQNLCRNVVLNPKRPKAYLSHIVSRVTHVNGRGSIFPEVTICDLWQPKKPNAKRRKSIAMDTYNGVYVTANPWESALTPDGKKIFTVYAGTDDVNVSTVIDDDYAEMERIGLPFRVGKNPRAIRVSPDGREIYIYNTLDFTVEVRNVNTLRREAAINICPPPKSPEWVRGKVLFQTAVLSGAKWISCSSCHPDGLTDGRTWQNGEGPRRVPPLLGLAHTHPLHWSADRDEVQDFEYTIRSKLMGGRGLIPGSIKTKIGFLPAEIDEKTSGRSKDLDALAIYTNSFNFRLSPHIPAPGKLSAEAERGKTIFFNKDVNCASCHSGPFYTDSKLAKPFNIHDIGTGNDPREKMGPKYDTPTLLGVYRNTEFLHHGKAKNLMEVLMTFNPKDQHGKTSHLTKDQKEDLVAFLKSLPYEMPPDEVPNTVPYRFKEARKE